MTVSADLSQLLGLLQPLSAQSGGSASTQESSFASLLDQLTADVVNWANAQGAQGTATQSVPAQAQTPSVPANPVTISPAGPAVTDPAPAQDQATPTAAADPLATTAASAAAPAITTSTDPVPIDTQIVEEATAAEPYPSTETPQQWVGSLYSKMLTAAGTIPGVDPALEMTPAQWSSQLASVLPGGDAVPNLSIVFRGTDPNAAMTGSVYWSFMAPAITAAYAIPGDFFPGIVNPAEQAAMGGSVGNSTSGTADPVPIDTLIVEEAEATKPYPSTETPQQWVGSLYSNMLTAAGTSPGVVPALEMTPAQWSSQLASVLPAGDAVPNLSIVFRGSDPNAAMTGSVYWSFMAPAITAAYAIPGDFFPGIVNPAEQAAMGGSVGNSTSGSADPVPIDTQIVEEAEATKPYPSTETPQQWVGSLYSNMLTAAGTSPGVAPAVEMTPAQWSSQLASVLPAGDAVPNLSIVFRGSDPNAAMTSSVYWSFMAPAITAAYAIPGDFFPGIINPAEQAAMGGSGWQST